MTTNLLETETSETLKGNKIPMLAERVWDRTSMHSSRGQLLLHLAVLPYCLSLTSTEGSCVIWHYTEWNWIYANS